MKVVLQRVKDASVKVDGKIRGRIGRGVCLLVGIEKGDSEEGMRYLADKIVDLRIFPDAKGRMNRSLVETQGEVLAVSQFTLAGSLKKGRRPSFDKAEDPLRAEELFENFVSRIKERGIRVDKGVFGAHMDVDLINDGPVTFIIQNRERESD
ncbi:MAG: D-aminoacyl-tRNA deacylase [Candidatus Aminicenantes bacterium]|jgi:D-tyrosyl-tRNA(Tyr) deacylase